MNTFNSSVKTEIIENLSKKDKRVRTSALSGIISSSGNLCISTKGLGLELEFEDGDVAYFTGELLRENGAQSEIVFEKEKGFKKRSYVITVYRENVNDLLKNVKIMRDDGNGLSYIEGIADDLVCTEDQVRAYLSGVFLGSGTVNIPDSADKISGYQLEIHFQRSDFAREVMALVSDFGIFPKTYDRENEVSVYLKDSQSISDVLAVMEANESVMSLQNVLVLRSVSNNANRQRNCNVANIDKTVTASGKQIIAIRSLEKNGTLQSLSDELQKTAKARVDFPSDTLDELAERLGVSKSAINHRLRKLVTLSGEK